MSVPTERLSARPWYREPWPWFLMALPATAVVAGIITMALAVKSYDGLVADDYYKQGLTINRRIAGEQLAASLQLRGQLYIEAGRAVLSLRAREGVTLPRGLRLSIINPVKAGGDLAVALTREGDGYAAAWPTVAPGHWNFVLEDPDSGWRVRGQALLPSEAPVEFVASAG